MDVQSNEGTGAAHPKNAMDTRWFDFIYFRIYGKLAG
jgi:hypothetical protein